MTPIISKVDFYFMSWKMKCKARVERISGKKNSTICDKQISIQRKKKTKQKIQEWKIKGKWAS